MNRRRMYNTMAKRKSSNTDLQNTVQKAKDRVTQTQLNIINVL